MRFKFLIGKTIIYCVILFTTSLFAQQQLEVKTYTQKDGVEYMVGGIEDSQGYSWFIAGGLLSGVYRFDGKKFEFQGHFGLHNISYTFGNNSGNFLKDKKGNVWYFSTNGLYQMCYGKPILKFAKFNGLKSDSVVSAVFDNQQNLWIATIRGIQIARFKPDDSHSIENISETYCYDFSKEIPEIMHEWKIIHSRGGLFADSSGSVYWAYYKKNENKTCVYKTTDYFKHKKVVSNSFNDYFIKLNFVNNEILFQNNSIQKGEKNRRSFYCNSKLEFTYLDVRFKDFLGIDFSGHYYFCDKRFDTNKPLYRITAKAFHDIENTKNIFEFKEKCNNFGTVIHVNGEHWITSNDMAGFIVKGNSLVNLTDIYPKITFKNTAFPFQNRDNTWVSYRQEKRLINFRTIKNKNVFQSPIQTNGISLRFYDKTESKFSYELQGLDNRLFKIDEQNHIEEKLNFGENIPSGQNGFNSTLWKFYDNRFEEIHSDCCIYKYLNVNQNFIRDVFPNSCIAQNPKDSTSYYFLSQGKIDTIKLHPNLNFTAFFVDKKHLLTFISHEKEVYSWDFKKETTPHKIFDLPNGKFTNLTNSGGLVFSKGSKTFWNEGKIIHSIDKTKFPKYDSVYFASSKNNKRYFISTRQNYFDEILVYENGNFNQFEFSDSIIANTELYIADVVDDSNELILLNGTKIYRYNKQLKQFYFIDDIASDVAFVWSAFVAKGKLHISGWSQKIVTIDLNKSEIYFPKLSISDVLVNNKSIAFEKLFTIKHDEKLVIKYIGIESFNKDNIQYQTRVILKNQSWFTESASTWETTLNGSKEIYNYPAGEYVLQIRCRGQSEIWGAPISINFKIVPPWFQTYWAYALFVLGVVLIIYYTVKINTARLKSANKKLQSLINIATTEIRQQKENVEQKNTEILDSIEYAKRIQATILPPPKVVKKYLEDSFILYIPKDIVAGDFYWMDSPTQPPPMGGDETQENSSDGKSPLWGDLEGQVLLFAACDCTGHGVPGALVSVVCSNALNRAVREYNIIQPSLILDKVSELVVQDFSKDENEEVQDGMDASLCSLNVKTGKLEWAGANNPLWIVAPPNLPKGEELRNSIDKQSTSKVLTLGEDLGGAFSLNEIRPDKQPIGKFDNKKPFTNHSIQLQKGDTIYMFTDGYADQFGGEKGKKYSKKAFRELVLSVAHLPLQQQREALYNAHQHWRGNNEQVDDICIIGVRV